MATLLEKLADYGMDVPGTMGRFVGNEKLYETCFNLLLGDKNFESLETSVAEKNYDTAFEAAHALKGMIANLGLTPLLNVLDVLVEALRAKDFGNLDAQYKDFQKAFEDLKAIL